MAAPKNNRTKPGNAAFERTRAKIQTTQLLKRLTCHALNKKDDAGNDVSLDNTHIQAIKILLDKSLPNLTATDLKVEPGGSFANMLAELYKSKD